ncbi:LytTR family DNA-binding domain-containing protein [Eubacteriales bacterium OttesenSCG-928-A19]|nr:LytTR family DNA-binding domain-containing protein [Eubacteriales bacterium OttesenSCG-928-A19]
MNPIRAVFADDDAGMRTVMRKILERSGGYEILGEAEDGEALLALVEAHHPQLVLLDVEMPGMTGVEAARVIQDTDPATLLIFATAHDQYMADAFSVYAFDYLLKPFKVDRALQTLEKVKQVLQLRASAEEALPLPPAPPRIASGRLMLKHREGVHFLNMEDILLVQRENRATVLYTVGDGRYVTSDSLAEMEAKLDGQMFFRCHKSYIINLGHIDNITPYGRWTYIVKLRGTRHDALITHEKYEELERMFA